MGVREWPLESCFSAFADSVAPLLQIENVDINELHYVRYFSAFLQRS